MKRHNAPWWIVLAAVVVSLPHVTLAQWATNGAPVFTGPGNQSVSDGLEWTQTIVPDGSGGTYIALKEFQDNVVLGAYVQHLDANGVKLWGTNGVLITSVQTNFIAILSQFAGGVVVVWNPTGTGDIRVKQLLANGTQKWSAVLVTSTASQTSAPALVSDGANGSIIAWSAPSGSPGYVVAQRYDTNGKRKWAVGGVSLSSVATADRPVAVPDASGGAVVAWQDHRSDAGDIWCQRVDASGVVQWGTSGVPACIASGAQSRATISSTGDGGAMVAWEDRRGANSDIYMQAMASYGGPLYSVSGVPVTVTPNDQTSPKILVVGADQSLVVWDDARTGTSRIRMTFMQFSSGGGAGAGMEICPDGGGSQSRAQLVSDGAGGAFVTWVDTRAGNNDIYAQRLQNFGPPNILPAWDSAGAPVSTTSDTQSWPVITSDGTSGPIVAWSDNRQGTNDVFAERLTPELGWDYPPISLLSVTDYPNDQGIWVLLTWTRRNHPMASFEVYRKNGGTWAPTGTYGVVPDDGHSNYTYVDLTLADSSCSLPNPTQFKVVAVDWLSISYESNVVTGQSVDNLAPPAANLHAQISGSPTAEYVSLHWNKTATDIDSWSVYRDGAYFDTVYDTTYVANFGPPFPDSHWKVRAYDEHCNVGALSNDVHMPPLNTFTGSNVVVSPRDPGTGTSPVSLTFSNVTGMGGTSLSSVHRGRRFPGTSRPATGSTTTCRRRPRSPAVSWCALRMTRRRFPAAKRTRASSTTTRR